MKEETYLAKVALKDKIIENIGDVLCELAPFKLTYPSVKKLCRLL